MNLKTEPIVITESSISINRKEQNDYLIPIKNSDYHTIIIHFTNTRIYFKNDDSTTDITNTAIPIPPTYGNRQMIRFDIKQLDDKYDSIILQLENPKSQIDIYQIKNDEQIVELST